VGNETYGGHLGLLAKACEPHGSDEGSTNEELKSREGPVEVGLAVGVLSEGDASLLVVDVVCVNGLIAFFSGKKGRNFV